MTAIANGTITFDQDELDWFTENYGTTEWAVYAAGVDETITHDMQGPGDDPHGNPFTEASARKYLAEMNARFGPGSPMDRECPGDPLYAVALHHGVPTFGSHEHSYPVQPPNGSFAHPGDCECGAPYADAERAWGDELAAVEWAVYITGPNVLHLAAHPTGPPFTEDTARIHADGINTEIARMSAAKPSPYNPVVHAVVLHHGVPVTDAAVA
jgi:hypothetical protein